MKVSIIAPASAVKREYVEGAMEFLNRQGFETVAYPSALGEPFGSYSASLVQRLRDFTDAWSDPEADVVLCARGGYGCIHLLPLIPEDLVVSSPKLLVGFSDVSALHALMHRLSIPSLHASMAKHLAGALADPFFAGGNEGDGSTVTLATRSLLQVMKEGRPIPIEAPASTFNRPGSAEGKLLGGNLAVLNSLAQTPWDMLAAPADEDVILFIEDISEAIYAVERMLCRLMMAALLQKVKGLIIGRFTEYRADRNFHSMEEMIHNRLKEWNFPEGIPVAYNFPTGHIEDNMPLLLGTRVRLTVSAPVALSDSASVYGSIAAPTLLEWL